MFYYFVETNNVKRMLIYLMTMVHHRETSRRSFQKYLFCFLTMKCKCRHEPQTSHKAACIKNPINLITMVRLDLSSVSSLFLSCIHW